MTKRVEITDVDVTRAWCLASHLNFTRYFFKASTGNRFIVGEHHKLIGAALDRVLRGDCARLIINMPPRYGKTEMVVKSFIAHGLAINPRARFLHLSYSSALASDNSRVVRELVASDEYRRLFPATSVPNVASAMAWRTHAGGGVYAVSSGGQVTGFGAGAVDALAEDKMIDTHVPDVSIGKVRFSGAVVIDDPLKPDDSLSDLRREAVNDKFESTIRSRTESRKTPIILIMQRLHDNDLAGHLIESEPGVWEVLSLPALDLSGKEPTALWPHKHTPDELMRMRKTSPIIFESQYQQNPRPIEGLLFPREEMTLGEVCKRRPGASYRFAICDPADKGGDYFATIFCDVFFSGDTCSVAVVDVLFNKDGIEANVDRLASKLAECGSEDFFVESNGGWAAAAMLFKSKIKSHTSVKPYTAKSNKMVRILSNNEFVIKNFIFANKHTSTCEYGAFLRHLCGMRKEGTNANDDSGDVAAAAANVVKVKFNSILFSKR